MPQELSGDEDGVISNSRRRPRPFHDQQKTIKERYEAMSDRQNRAQIDCAVAHLHQFLSFERRILYF